MTMRWRKVFSLRSNASCCSACGSPPASSRVARSSVSWKVSTISGGAIRRWATGPPRSSSAAGTSNASRSASERIVDLEWRDASSRTARIRLGYRPLATGADQRGGPAPDDPSRFAHRGVSGAAPRITTLRTPSLRISRLNSVASPLAVYASRRALPHAMQHSLPAGRLRLCRAGFEPAGPQ